MQDELHDDDDNIKERPHHSDIVLKACQKCATTSRP